MQRMRKLQINKGILQFIYSAILIDAKKETSQIWIIA